MCCATRSSIIFLWISSSSVMMLVGVSNTVRSECGLVSWSILLMYSEFLPRSTISSRCLTFEFIFILSACRCLPCSLFRSVLISWMQVLVSTIPGSVVQYVGPNSVIFIVLWASSIGFHGSLRTVFVHVVIIFFIPMSCSCFVYQKSYPEVNFECPRILRVAMICVFIAINIGLQPFL